MSLEILVNTTPAAIVGEAEAGQGAKVRKQLKSLLKVINTNNFDLMDLLHEVKTKKYYLPQYDTYKEFTDTLELKSSKAYYLVRIKEAMLTAGLARPDYENVSTLKLRAIASILSVKDFEGKPVSDIIKQLVIDAATQTFEEIKSQVDTVTGNVGDEAFEFITIKIKKSALKVVKQAFELAKANIGSTGQDSEGISQDASDGKILEDICLDYLSDPNNGALTQPDGHA